MTTITQDSHGFLWFGTYSGLSRFDGHEFKVYKYDEHDNNSICDNMIGSIMEDSQGKLWIGTSLRGLSIMDQSREQLSHYPGGVHDSLMVADPIMTKIYEDSHGYVWLGSKNGLTIVTPDRTSYTKYIYDPYSNQNQINGKEVLDIVEDAWNRVWIATNSKKLCMYDMLTDRFSEVAYTDYPLNNEQDDHLKNLYLQNDSHYGLRAIWWLSNQLG